jgi:integrase
MGWSALDKRPLRKTFPTLRAARARRQETQVALRRRRLRAPSAITVAEAAESWLAAATAGVVRTRAGTPYKPSALRGYESALRLRVLPALGQKRLSGLDRNTLQDLLDGWVAGGLGAGTARNNLLPVQAILRRAVERGELAQNPATGLALPRQRHRRRRIAPPAEARALIEALPEHLRALWATAIYAGLRRGELQGLRWADVDLANGVIRVERSWDERAGPIAPKSESGRRRVPVAATLRRYLAAHRLRQGGGEGFVFSSRSGSPFWTTAMMRSARRAWDRAGLAPITLHECRHSCAGLMIAAGVNAKALSAYLGHSSITVTLDRYGHLMPGAEHEAAALLEGYLGAGDAPARARAPR